MSEEEDTARLQNWLIAIYLVKQLLGLLGGQASMTTIKLLGDLSRSIERDIATHNKKVMQ